MKPRTNNGCSVTKVMLQLINFSGFIGFMSVLISIGAEYDSTSDYSGYMIMAIVCCVIGLLGSVAAAVALGMTKLTTSFFITLIVAVSGWSLYGIVWHLYRHAALSYYVTLTNSMNGALASTAVFVYCLLKKLM